MSPQKQVFNADRAISRGLPVLVCTDAFRIGPSSSRGLTRMMPRYPGSTESLFMRELKRRGMSSSTSESTDEGRSSSSEGAWPQRVHSVQRFGDYATRPGVTGTA